METMKNNVVGLGNYINSINSDLGSMLTSFDGYAKKVNNDIAYMKSNVSELNNDVDDMNLKTEDMKIKMDTMDYSTTTLKADVTELTTKIYNIKTSGFEHSNEISAVKSKIKGLENNLDAILKQFSKLREEENGQNVGLESVKSDLTNVKTSMTSISASLLNLKSQVASNYEMDQKVRFFYVF